MSPPPLLIQLQSNQEWWVGPHEILPSVPTKTRPSQLVRLDSPWMGQVHDRYLNKGQKMMRGQWGVEERDPMTTLLEIIIKKKNQAKGVSEIAIYNRYTIP